MIAERHLFHPLVRPLVWDDLDRIMAIELAAYPHPWTRGIFSDCLRVGYDCWGLQLGTRLVGYSVQSDAAGESHLLNLCVAPEWQRRGCGPELRPRKQPPCPARDRKGPRRWPSRSRS